MSTPTRLVARIAEVETDVSQKNGRPFMRLILEPGGRAYCWRENIFDKVKQAARSRGPVVLGLEPSQIPQRSGEPYCLVVSVE